MKVLRPRPLTRQDFAPFGDVIQCEGAHHYPINGGTTERFHDLARIEPGEGGRAIVSVFRAQPRSFPFTLTMMERHPLGSQAFVPLNGRPYLVVVAEAGPTDEVPGTLHAFIAQGNQGVNYAPGVWHHPLLAVGEVSEFLVVDRKGEGRNCDEALLAEAFLLECDEA